MSKPQSLSELKPNPVLAPGVMPNVLVLGTGSTCSPAGVIPI
jgi:hypothetical protein